ncbi:hypothetical protein [Acrocarpospora phusangensis]|nr:hypothetical protein [Acrocarpospora phusangensis]
MTSMLKYWLPDLVQAENWQLAWAPFATGVILKLRPTEDHVP